MVVWRGDDGNDGCCGSLLFFWLLLLEGLVVCGQSELAFIGMHSWLSLSLSLLLVSQVNEGRVGVGVVGIVVRLCVSVRSSRD